MTRAEPRRADRAPQPPSGALDGALDPVSRRVYRPPQLTRHGCLAEVTRFGGSIPTDSGGNLGQGQP